MGNCDNVSVGKMFVSHTQVFLGVALGSTP